MINATYGPSKEKGLQVKNEKKKKFYPNLDLASHPHS